MDQESDRVKGKVFCGKCGSHIKWDDELDNEARIICSECGHDNGTVGSIVGDVRKFGAETLKSLAHQILKGK